MDHRHAAIPLPVRPGTMWDIRGHVHESHHRCNHCGKEYNSHGCPTPDAKVLGIPEDKRHLACPATDEQWEEYRRLVQTSSIEGIVQLWMADLSKFTFEEQCKIFKAVREQVINAI